MKGTNLFDAVEVISVINSFSVISCRSCSLWIDPWVNPANAGSWAPLVKDANYSSLDYLFINYRPDYIYISHMHTDHLDENFLRYIKIKSPETKIFIKKFQAGVFKNKIVRCVGQDSVVEINAYTEINLGEISFVVIPQFNNSSSDEISSLEFDLDTSIIIRTKYGLIYNEIDNPLKLQDYPDIFGLLPINFIDQPAVAFLGFSSATDYPQSYIAIDRSLEKERLINRSVQRFYEVAKWLKVPIVIPAGGNYKLNGHLAAINDFSAVPSFTRVDQFIGRDPKLRVIDPAEKYIVMDESGVVIRNRIDDIPKNPFVESSFSCQNEILKSLTEDDKVALRDLNVQDLIARLEQESPSSLINLFRGLRTTVTLNIATNFPEYHLVQGGDQGIVCKHIIFGGGLGEINLNLWCSELMMYAWLMGRISWNDLYFYCISSREPNIYEPDIGRALNYYKFPRSLK
jgi:hypothetical protein